MGIGLATPQRPAPVLKPDFRQLHPVKTPRAHLLSHVVAVGGDKLRPVRTEPRAPIAPAVNAGKHALAPFGVLTVKAAVGAGVKAQYWREPLGPKGLRESFQFFGP